jgi:phosphatidylserine decarboxylase
MFKKYDIFINEALSILDPEVISGMSYERSQELMSNLFPVRNKKLESGVIDSIIKYLEDGAKYKTPKNYFEDVKYETYMDYFRRKLSINKSLEISKNNNLLAFPCECDVESFGSSRNTKGIVRLKESKRDAIEDFRNHGIQDVHHLNYIDMKLMKCFYHRIHSPINGVISKIDFYGKDDPFFGDNTLWIVKIDSNFGAVYLVLVGELSIQDFEFNYSVGDSIKQYDEIGHFEWGSQVILFYDPKKFQEPNIQKGNRYFIGDKLI